MKLRPLILLAALLLATVLLYPSKNKPPQTEPPPTVLAALTQSDSHCRIRGLLPDPNCTPGSTDPAVTQDNLERTICAKGYTASVRPKPEYTNKLKAEQIKAYGYTDTNPKHYEEDHLISLELGGHPTDPKNLWPQPGASPNTKDQTENTCREKICRGQISLEQAQRQIAADWTTACQ